MELQLLIVVLFCVFVRGWAAPTGDNPEHFPRLPALQEEEYHEISPELLDVYKDFELLNKLEKENITRLPIINEEDFPGIPPELLEIYHDIQILHKLDDANITFSRENRKLLSKLHFLTGLQLGGLLLPGSGSYATSQSFSLLGKLISYALSASYAPEESNLKLDLPEVVPSNYLRPIVGVGENIEAIEKNRDMLVEEHNKRIAELNRRNRIKKNVISRVGKVLEFM